MTKPSNRHAHCYALLASLQRAVTELADAGAPLSVVLNAAENFYDARQREAGRAPLDLGEVLLAAGLTEYACKSCGGVFYSREPPDKCPRCAAANVFRWVLSS
jgi:rubrerythrin